MKVTLRINGKNKTFTQDKINFLHIRRGTDLLSRMEKGKFLSDTSDLMADLEEAVDFIVESFGNAFTADEFNEGYEPDGAVGFRRMIEDMLQEIQYGSVYRETINEMEKKTKQIKKNSKK